jgi:hypothetical protein
MRHDDMVVLHLWNVLCQSLSTVCCVIQCLQHAVPVTVHSVLCHSMPAACCASYCLQCSIVLCHSMTRACCAVHCQQRAVLFTDHSGLCHSMPTMGLLLTPEKLRGSQVAHVIHINDVYNSGTRDRLTMWQMWWLCY